MTDLICIVCPKGCHLKVDEENGYKVTGNGCPRGAAYGEKELVNPTRAVSYTHLRAHETEADLVCRLLLEKIFF